MSSRPTWHRHRRAATFLVVVLGATLGLAGCSSSDKQASSGGPTGASPEATGHLDEALAALYKGTSTPPATTAPKPAPGKKVWIVSSGQAIDVAAQASGGAADAAKMIGWSSKVFDGQFQPNLALSGVQQAIAAKADGIILYAIDCSNVKAGLESAKRAGIPVVGIESRDCTPSLETPLSYGPTYGEFDGLEKGWGAAAASWLVAKSAPTGTVIELKETDSAATLLISEGFQASVKAGCAGCTVKTVTFTATDIGPALQQKTQQALLQSPDAKGLFAPYDALMTSGVAAAVQASGRAKAINVISGGGSVPNLDLIRQHRGQNADLIFSSRWEGFAAIDWLNRIFNGTTPAADTSATGIGFQLVDEDHNLTPTGPVPSTVDFEAAYNKAWGV